MPRSIFDNTWTPGFLEAIEERDTIDFLKDARTQLRETMLKNYEPTKLDQHTEFNAICLKQLKTQNTTGKNIIRIKARIPEIHSMLPIPESATDWRTIELYPTFRGIANDFNPVVQNGAIAPGSRMVVTFENMANFSGPSIVRLFNIQDVNNSDNPNERRRGGRAGPTAPFPKRADGTAYPECSPRSTVIEPVYRGKYTPDKSATLTSGLVSLAKGLDGLISTGYFSGSGRKYKKVGAQQGAPAGGIAGTPSVADDYYNLAKACETLKIYNPPYGGTPAPAGHHKMSSFGFMRKITKGHPEFCRFTIFSMHKLGRAFDLFTHSTYGGGYYLAPENPKIMFLVTLSNKPNQTVDDWNSYASQFFQHSLIPGTGKSGAYAPSDAFAAYNPDAWAVGTRDLANAKVNWAHKRNRGIRKFTLWAKCAPGVTPGSATVQGISPQQVTLQVCNPQSKGRWFNSETRKEWTGVAFNFTALASKFQYFPISAYSKWCKGLNRKLTAGAPDRCAKPDENEWHHFQNHRGLQVGTRWGDEVLATGYPLSELQNDWNQGNQKMWDFYKNAVWTGTTWRRQGSGNT